MDDIDDILDKNNFYEKAPNSLAVHSLYDYIIVGTKEAVKLTLNGSNENMEDKDF